MKKLIILLFCIITTTVSAESFKYLYAGDLDVSSRYYKKINSNPVSLNFLEDNEAIQLVVEGESIMFYITGIQNVSEYEMKITTITKSGDRVNFVCFPQFIIFSVEDIGYVITDVPKYAWND